MDSLLLKSPEALKRMPINKRAEEKVLDAELSIKDIALLRYIDDKDKQKALIGGIIAECKAKKISYDGDINGWTWGGKYGENPYKNITTGKSNSREARPGDNYLRDVLNNDTSIYSGPEECLIHRDEFKRYLQSVDDGWPIKDCLLSNWWMEIRTEVAPASQNNESKPWLIADLKDPDTKQLWYTPARYFARQLIKDDSTLLVKRNILAEKVARSLYAAGFTNRSKKQYDPGTVLKAFSNVSFS